MAGFDAANCSDSGGPIDDAKPCVSQRRLARPTARPPCPASFPKAPIEAGVVSLVERTTGYEGPHEMKKRCRGCTELLDSSSFYHSNQEPDGLQQLCRSCVNKRRRERYETKRSKADHADPPRLQDLVKKGDLAAVKKNKTLINARNREHLLAVAVTDFKSAPKKLSHVELVKFLMQQAQSQIFIWYVQRP